MAAYENNTHGYGLLVKHLAPLIRKKIGVDQLVSELKEGNDQSFCTITCFAQYLYYICFCKQMKLLLGKTLDMYVH